MHPNLNFFFFCFRSENDGNTDIEADKVTPTG